MKIFITGGTGFVGTHLIRTLCKNPKNKVFYLCRDPEKAKSKNLPGNPIMGDLKNLKNLSQLPFDLDIVVHLASVVHAFDTKKFHQVNVEGTKNLVYVLRKKYSKLKFINISSLAAFGPMDGLDRPISEIDLPMPVSEYGKSKLAQETWLNHHFESWDLVILRPPMVIGAGDPAFDQVVQMVKNKIILYPALNGGKKEYSFISVDDLVRSIRDSIEKECNGEYFVSYPIPISYEELIKEISHQLALKPFVIKVPLFVTLILSYLTSVLYKFFKIDLRLTPDKYNELKPNKWICDSTRFQRVYDFKYKDDLRITIKKLLT